MICKKCHSETENPLFCLKCGEIVDAENYQNQELIERYSQEIKEFLKQSQEQTNSLRDSLLPPPPYSLHLIKSPSLQAH